jgi:hypothetical protein
LNDDFIEIGKKKSLQYFSAGSLYSLHSKKSKVRRAKGEEKPEEELMGKRKSSPRLATTSN